MVEQRQLDRRRELGAVDRAEAFLSQEEPPRPRTPWAGFWVNLVATMLADYRAEWLTRHRVVVEACWKQAGLAVIWTRLSWGLLTRQRCWRLRGPLGSARWWVAERWWLLSLIGLRRQRSVWRALERYLRELEAREILVNRGGRFGWGVPDEPQLDAARMLEID